GHRRGRRPEQGRRAAHPREREEMSGVVASLDATPQHGIVAGALAFAPEARAGQPGERGAPEDRPDRFRGDLHAPVVAADVGELVTEDDADAIVRPAGGP